MLRSSCVALLFAAIFSGCLASCEPPTGTLALEHVAQGLTNPLFVVAPPGDSSRLFVVEQGGTIRIVKEGTLLDTPFLDISERIADSGGERGLLGLAFHPRFSENGFFFVNYTDENNNTNISRFVAADDTDVANHASEKIILEQDQPFPNHNGGMLAFGDDGYLYIALGDGGSANDPNGNGQNTSTLLGKILRIDVDRGDPYEIPADNRFVGVPNTRPEIWAYGLRNPWRFSFDRETQDLWIADVGQSTREEINFEPADSPGGNNYGWSVREGSICRPGEEACELPGAVNPIHEYDKAIAQSITGGYVYRGDAIPSLRGSYFFADYVAGEVWSLRRNADGSVEVTNHTGDLRPQGLLSTISSFGEDANGELYIVSYNGGTVYRIIPG